MKRIVCTDYTQLGKELKSIRVNKKLRLRSLEEQSGISISTISMIEQGKQYPRISTLMSYAKALDIDEIVIKTTNSEPAG